MLMKLILFIVRRPLCLTVCWSVLLVSCVTTSPEQYWINQHQQCIAQQNRLQKPQKIVEEYCQQWKSPLRRAQWLEKNQGDPILIVENYLRHLKRFPDSQKAKKRLIQARINYIDYLVLQMDLAIEQKNSLEIWKLAKSFSHIENLLKNHAPVPVMLSHYIRDTPEINQALQTIESEINQAFQQDQSVEILKSSEGKGRFYRGFKAVLVVFCQNETGVCQERYRTYKSWEE